MKKLIVLVITGLLVVIGAVWSVVSYAEQVGEKVSPPVLTRNFVDLSMIEAISKYRSCHDRVVVSQDEREGQRNMQHYFRPKAIYNETDEQIYIYAPFDGYVTVLKKGTKNSGGDIWLSAKKTLGNLPPLGQWSVSIQPFTGVEGLKVGDEVLAGEHIGNVALDQYADTFQVTYAKIGIPSKSVDGGKSPYADLDSVFNHMSLRVLKEYEERSLGDWEEFLISKAARDAELCVYQGEGPEFTYTWRAKEEWVKLY